MRDDRHIRLADVRFLMRLSDSLHSASHPVERKRRMLAGLCQLTNAQSGAVLVNRFNAIRSKGSLVSVVTYDRSAENGNSLCQTKGSFLNGQPCDQLKGLSEELMAWVLIQRGDSHRLACSARLPEQPGIVTVHLFRSTSPFTRRHRSLVQLFHNNTRWLHEGDLAMLSSDAKLITRREHQTLELLLLGLSEKQIAKQMGLSHNTVHHYVKSLHRHFRVSSRSELLARWVGKQRWQAEGTSPWKKA